MAFPVWPFKTPHSGSWCHTCPLGQLRRATWLNPWQSHLRDGLRGASRWAGANHPSLVISGCGLREAAMHEKSCNLEAEGSNYEGDILSVSGILSPQMGNKRLGWGEFSHIALHLGPHYSALPKVWSWAVPESSSLKGKPSYSPKELRKGKASADECGGCSSRTEGSNW
jgi:hypothetical protein